MVVLCNRPFIEAACVPRVRETEKLEVEMMKEFVT